MPKTDGNKEVMERHLKPLSSLPSEDVCCGSCAFFLYEDADGFGVCHHCSQVMMCADDCISPVNFFPTDDEKKIALPLIIEAAAKIWDTQAKVLKSRLRMRDIANARRMVTMMASTKGIKLKDVATALNRCLSSIYCEQDGWDKIVQDSEFADKWIEMQEEYVRILNDFIRKERAKNDTEV